MQNIFPLPFCECQSLPGKQTSVTWNKCKQRIGFRVYGVVEKPNRIVKFRGSEQQETMSVLRTEGPKGRVHVFKTALLLAWGLSGGSWSQRRCCCCCSCNSRQEKGKRGSLRSPCSTLPSPTLHLTGVCRAQTHLEPAEPGACRA